MDGLFGSRVKPVTLNIPPIPARNPSSPRFEDGNEERGALVRIHCYVCRIRRPSLSCEHCESAHLRTYKQTTSGSLASLCVLAASEHERRIKKDTQKERERKMKKRMRCRRADSDATICSDCSNTRVHALLELPGKPASVVGPPPT